jgi:hypothetical protein
MIMNEQLTFYSFYPLLDLELQTLIERTVEAADEEETDETSQDYSIS